MIEKLQGWSKTCKTWHPNTVPLRVTTLHSYVPWNSCVCMYVCDLLHWLMWFLLFCCQVHLGRFFSSPFIFWEGSLVKALLVSKSLSLHSYSYSAATHQGLHHSQRPDWERNTCKWWFIPSEDKYLLWEMSHPPEMLLPLSCCKGVWMTA